MLDVDLACVASLVGQRLCAPGFHDWRVFSHRRAGIVARRLRTVGYGAWELFRGYSLPATGVGGAAAARQTWPDFSLFGLRLWTLDFGLWSFVGGGVLG